MNNAFSREFLGDNPTKNNILLIFTTAFLVMGAVSYFNYEQLSTLPIWKLILFLVMILDIVSGAVANYTRSTQLYYQAHTKRITFLLLHFVHIGLIVLAVGHIWYCLAVLGFTLAGAFIVNFTKILKQQEIIAAVIVNLGIILFYVVFPAPQILNWLPGILLMKLVFGFAINREKKETFHLQ